MQMEGFILQQKEICLRFEAEYKPLDLNSKLGISDNFFSGTLPLNGLRVKQERGTCGWYLWAGEIFSQEDDFFNPMHVFHILERSSSIFKYLALLEGWRFLSANEYQDVWLIRQSLKIKRKAEFNP